MKLYSLNLASIRKVIEKQRNFCSYTFLSSGNTELRMVLCCLYSGNPVILLPPWSSLELITMIIMLYFFQWLSPTLWLLNEVPVPTWHLSHLQSNLTLPFLSCLSDITQDFIISPSCLTVLQSLFFAWSSQPQLSLKKAYPYRQLQSCLPEKSFPDIHLTLRLALNLFGTLLLFFISSGSYLNALCIIIIM